MRIAWLTPLARYSAIGRYSLSAVRALSELAHVDVFYPATDQGIECQWADANKALGDPTLAAELFRSYDVVLYNFGNNAEYHAEIYEHYLRAPGVSILHDRVMQGFFTSYRPPIRHDPHYYVRLMTHVYGARGHAMALNVLTKGWTPSLEMQTAEKYPLFEPCLFNAIGAVVHSAGAAHLAAARYGALLPIATIELPTFVYDLEYAGRSLLDRGQLDLAKDTVVVVSSGRMNSPKRLDVLIRVIGGDAELAQRVTLVLAGGGDPEYVDVLRRVVRDNGLSESVRFVLRPDDHLMHSYIAAADICVNLRNPSTESASASLVEQLHFGKPVLVSRVGVYSEIPDDIVTKTDIEDEDRSIREGLRRLVLDEDYRARVAAAAGAYADAHHSPRNYARRVMEFLEDLPSRSANLRLVDKASRALVDLGEGESIPRAAREMAHELMSQLDGSCDRYPRVRGPA